MSQQIPTSEVLNLAADLIQERGWEQGDGWVTDESSATDSLCLEGGIMAAMGMSIPAETEDDRKFAPLLACPAYRAVSRYLDRVPAAVTPDGYGFTGQPLYWWNDETARDASHVIEVLRAAAVIESAREQQDAAFETYAAQVSA